MKGFCPRGVFEDEAGKGANNLNFKGNKSCDGGPTIKGKIDMVWEGDFQNRKSVTKRKLAGKQQGRKKSRLDLVEKIGDRRKRTCGRILRKGRQTKPLREGG